MSLKGLISKYIGCSEEVFREIRITKTPVGFNIDSIVKVVDSARDYLEDAKYYMEKQKFEVSLTSVAYCEGLLDALKLLGAVEFEWPSKRKKGKSGK